MATRVLQKQGAGSILVPIEIGSSCDSTRTAPTTERLSYESESEMESNASVAGLGCVKGTTLVLKAEAVVALGIYAIWQILHLVR